jgi:uncharacterized protein YndB with AHSA1/START domain
MLASDPFDHAGEQMPDKPERACLLLADISGYTTYLAGVELDHAQDILADLTGTVVRALRPTFRLAKLEGDAAFAYVVTDAVDGSILQDTIEHCYIAFRRRLRDIGQASQCDCNACTYLPRLDLKFVVHHGQIARQRMAGREELVGRDVIVVHRLLKNNVEPALGIRAYALYTDECVRIMGIEDPAAAGLVEHRETYEVVGEVSGWVRDLEAVWQDAESIASVVVEPPQTGWGTTFTFDGPPAIVWEWVTSPARRLQWQLGVDAVNEDVLGGRRGVGTTNHCVHGRDAIVEEILAWHPPELLTTRFQMPGGPKLTRSELFEATPDGGGTLFTVRVQRPSSAKDRARLEEMTAFLDHAYGQGLAALAPLVEAEVAARAAEAVPEPELPVSAGRNLVAMPR